MLAAGMEIPVEVYNEQVSSQTAWQPGVLSDSIPGTFYNVSVTQIVRMICAKNCEKLSKFVE